MVRADKLFRLFEALFGACQRFFFSMCYGRVCTYVLRTTETTQLGRNGRTGEGGSFWFLPPVLAELCRLFLSLFFLGGEINHVMTMSLSHHLFNALSLSFERCVAYYQAVFAFQRPSYQKGHFVYVRTYTLGAWDSLSPGFRRGDYDLIRDRAHRWSGHESVHEMKKEKRRRRR